MKRLLVDQDEAGHEAFDIFETAPHDGRQLQSSASCADPDSFTDLVFTTASVTRSNLGGLSSASQPHELL